MKGSIGTRVTEVIGIGLISLLLPGSLGNTPVSRSSACDDFCEREARKAYAEVLKLCQLAETENPRLKCYEAAKAVYLQKLEECKRGRSSSSGQRTDAGIIQRSAYFGSRTLKIVPAPGRLDTSMAPP